VPCVSLSLLPLMMSIFFQQNTDQRCLKEKDMTHLNGMKLVPTKQTTEPKPFSFEVRENERLARKNARLQAVCLRIFLNI